MTESVRKFDPERANEYGVQSRIALAGYEACHELTACMLAAILGADRPANILVAGAGGGAQEVIAARNFAPRWRFTAVDPSEPMLQLSVARLEELELMGRVDVRLGYVSDLALEPRFDAATLIGVLHHLRGDEEKLRVLGALAARLKAGAPLVVAGNRYAYASKPLLLSAWGERWRMYGASAEEIRAKHGKILQGADPPHSGKAVIELLARAGFERAELFFSSLFWGAWLAYRTTT